MNIEKIKNIYKDYKPDLISEFKRFAVTIPLVEIDNEVNIVFEIRADHLPQPREVSLPGGAVEKGEEIYDAALRELNEELGIKKEKVRLISQLDYFTTPFNFVIYPFLIEIKDFKISDIRPNEEVKEYFFVPLKFFLNNEPLKYKVNIKMEPPEDYPYHLIPNGKNYNWRKGYYKTLFYLYENKIIWGLTARIIDDFKNTLKIFSLTF
ncbi:CoA pyrophosphatase [Marinitoga sp. 1138]|uniref:NUDIX hydrolase n=1 Tax=Marinitoga sp. 1138 TaxID=1643334 RepID=UPI001585E2CB|nr:CoA pyrophosphatase [Marinitoga sp. 1138]NUU98214.1 hypothetical protein [Marinitoga sp. 1138]